MTVVAAEAAPIAEKALAGRAAGGAAKKASGSQGLVKAGEKASEAAPGARGGGGGKKGGGEKKAGGGGGKGKAGGGKAESKAGGRARRSVAWAFSGSQRVLTGEFLACVVIVGAGTFTAPKGTLNAMPRAMVKVSGLAGLFLVLALASSAGKSAAKVATGIGTLVTAAYVFTSADAHNVVKWVATFFNPAGHVSQDLPTGSGPNTQEAVTVMQGQIAQLKQQLAQAQAAGDDTGAASAQQLISDLEAQIAAGG